MLKRSRGNRSVAVRFGFPLVGWNVCLSSSDSPMACNDSCGSRAWNNLRGIMATGTEGSEPNPTKAAKDYSDIKGEFGVDKEADIIKDHIDQERNQLTEKLRELESRVKNVTDVREQYNKYPLIGVGLAFAGGVLLSSMIRTDKSASATREFKEELSRRRQSSALTPFSKLSNTLENVVEAFVGLASAKISSVIADAVPGFREQYERIEKKSSAPVGEAAVFSSTPRRAPFR